MSRAFFVFLMSLNFAASLRPANLFRLRSAQLISRFHSVDGARGSTNENNPKHQVFFVLGGPGSGKGTQCERLMKEFDLCHLSAGELLRKERQSGSPQGQLIESFLVEGKIVPVSMSLSLLKREMDNRRDQIFLIDGFPRNQDNVNGWDKDMKDCTEILGVLYFDCSEQVLTQAFSAADISVSRRNSAGAF
jgi:adenylate kinase family enzyme